MEAVARASEWKGWRNACASLREWRGTGEKRSDLVLQLGAKLLKDHSSRLGAEGTLPQIDIIKKLCVPLLACVLVWDVHEQVCVAAMDCGDMLTAKVCSLPSKRIVLQNVLCRPACHSCRGSFLTVCVYRL